MRFPAKALDLDPRLELKYPLTESDMQHEFFSQPLVLLTFQAVAIMALSRLLGFGARRIGQPLVIAEITAGVLLGPSFLGWLWPDAMQFLFPPTSLPVLGLLSQVGLVLFMFLVGLELDPSLLKGRGHTSVAISHSSIIIPFIMGAGLAWYLHPRFLGPEVPFDSFALFLGVSMSVTAFPVLARILNERGLMRSKIGSIAIACAAVDDVTAWCLLALVVSVVRSHGLIPVLTTTGLTIVYILSMLFWLRPFLSKLAARSMATVSVSHNLMALVFVLLFASSMVTEAIGIHALFGAFVFGAVVPRENGFARALEEKLEDVAVVFLLPLFFAFSGLRTQFGLLDSPEEWYACAIIIGVACLGKFGGSYLACRWTGLDRRESSAIGILMNTRGLVELVVLNIGLDLGVLSPKLFTMLVLMALVTTFLTSPILHWVYPQRIFERELAAREPTALENVIAHGYGVLTCLANPASWRSLVQVTAGLVRGSGELARMHALRLLEPAHKAENHPLDPAISTARALGIEARPLSFVSERPSEDICRVAEVKGVDLVLVGSRATPSTLLEGVTRDVLVNAPAHVGVLVDRGLDHIQRILVPFRGTGHDTIAVDLASRIAVGAKALVTLLDLREDNAPSVDSLRAEDGSLLGGIEWKRVHTSGPGEAADAVAQESKSGYDLVVVGVGLRFNLDEVLPQLGSFVDRLVEDSSTSLLIVRRYADAGA